MENSSISIDVDELIEKLKAIKEDEYSTVKLSIEHDEYSSSLLVEATSIDRDDAISYGSIDESSDEL